MKTILLNPGPVTLSERVRQALLGDDLCHREVEFASLQSGIRNKLLDIYQLADTEWAATLMTGSGTAAVEAMVTSLVPATGKLLILENGVYGERMTRIAGRYGIRTVSLRNNWEAPIDYVAVGEALAADPEITHVAIVHHETTTGRLNDLAPLAMLCAQHKVFMLLDAVSSFGAEVIDFANWPIAAAAATANKCLHGVPGTCFVIVNRDALANAHPRSVYLDLVAYIAAQDKAGTPFTQSVQTFYALNEALNELIEQGGVETRRQTYRSRMGRIRSLLTEIGVRPFLDDDEVSCVLHAYELPSTTNYIKLHDDLKAQGFVIYAGQGPYAEKIFRISMMGEIADSDVDRLGRALQAALRA
ncbi:MAG: 2-aminoethylphosphonate aminotransferase [Proteobacteria bacterium]|nr:2-aminoethylphosphonate aminotransferase [Pseudomonadota bacterium]